MSKSIKHKALSLLFAGYCGFSYANDPALKIFYRQVGNGLSIELFAENATTGTVSSLVNIEGSGIKSNTAFPKPVTVLAHQRIYIGTVEATDKIVFKVINSCQFGKFSATSYTGSNYRLPFQNGVSAKISQSFDTPVKKTHKTSESFEAVDFMIPEGTPVVASREGVVVDAKFDYYMGGDDPKLMPYANVVYIEHVDGSVAQYAHLKNSKKIVNVGDHVYSGQIIGYSGNTGYTSGPHLHFAVMRPTVDKKNNEVYLESLPVTFYTNNPQRLFRPNSGTIVKAQ